MNLLIVEDDVRLASALAHILEEAGHAVDTANDGETGYAYASQGKYDVAILDVMLPKKNGSTSSLTCAAPESPPRCSCSPHAMRCPTKSAGSIRAPMTT